MVPAIFIGRWTLEVLFSLQEKPYRHRQLRRHVGSVSQRMLTRTLRNLESTGLIAPLRGMCRWAKRYRKGVTAVVYLSQAHPAQRAKRGISAGFFAVLNERRSKKEEES